MMYACLPPVKKFINNLFFKIIIEDETNKLANFNRLSIKQFFS